MSSAMFGVCTDIKHVAAKSKKAFPFPSTNCELGSTQEGFSKEKETSCETRLHSVECEDSVDQQDQPASPVTSSSFEHQSVASNRSGDGKNLPCDFLVPSTSSSTDSSTEGDTNSSDSTKTAEEPVDTI